MKVGLISDQNLGRDVKSCLINHKCRLQGSLPIVCKSVCHDGATFAINVHKVPGFDSWRAAQISYENGDFEQANEYEDMVHALFC